MQTVEAVKFEQEAAAGLRVGTKAERRE